MRHVGWLLGAVQNFRFFDARIFPLADPEIAMVKAEALIRPTGRTYRQEYVFFLSAKGGKISHLREYFDPVRAARAMDARIDLSP